MKRIYITAIPLDSNFAITPYAAEPVNYTQTTTQPTCYPITPILADTAHDGDEIKVIAVRQVNSPHSENLEVFRRELDSLGKPYTLLVQEVATCSYCGGTGHTASACPSKAAAEQTQAASVAQQAAEPAAPAEAAPQQPDAAQPAEQAAADPGYAVDWACRRIYSQGDADIPEGGVVQRPDGSRYIKGPLNVIFGYDSCPEDTDLSQPGNTPFTGDCVFCGDYGHDVYHCPILAAEQDPDAFCGD